MSNQHILDNSGQKPLQTPGFGDIPLYFELGGDSFTHGASDWHQSERITAREISMLRLMNSITDKSNWQIDIFDNKVVERWQKEVTETFYFISSKAWEWCITELRDKALEYEKKRGCISIFESDSIMIKSDLLVPPTLRLELAEHFAVSTASSRDDWHLDSAQSVLNLVDPSLFPLVYGKTKVLTNGGQVSLDTVFDSYGRGNPSPLHLDERDTARRNIEKQGMIFRSNHAAELDRWSTNFQWLPCEVDFVGETGTNVRISSYINNLHPINHRPAYATIERLISLVIEPWNEVLIKGGRGRMPRRIKTWGAVYVKPPKFNYPTHLYVLEQDQTSEEYLEALNAVREYMALPELGEGPIDPDLHIPADWESCPRDGYLKLGNLVHRKWLRMCYAIHPEPGMSFTYDEWKLGKTSKAIIPKIDHFIPDNVVQDTDHQHYSVAIQDEFRKQGLQVIVKMASIELGPDKPFYPGDN